MKNVMLMLCMLLLAVPAFGLTYDQNVTPDVIFGSGNANGHFTVDQANGVELGLRGKVRFNASGLPENTFNELAPGEYYFLAGVGTGQSDITPTWAFEWSVNTDFAGAGNGLVGDFAYELGLDYDPSPATNYLVFDPITPNTLPMSAPYWDHSMGDNSTANGAGVEAGDAPTYTSYLQTYNVAQNSWRYSWFDGFSTFNPNDTGVYDIYLAAFSSGTEVARTHIEVHVYNETPVADEASTWGGVKSLFR
ncbi:hypothetical protein GW813_04935 [bacterium]|nr:hypothetical protein [bacterium]PIV81738.1 MAG: hypothetical protein COW53_02750 [bacterium CG17_big_fil_post_rev_8_21_14_2_50_64_8]PJA74200.1 MAG: hypothetical protein CO151_10545 [bacterium CG_4_9_14_3_um_filter_65_15]